MNINSIVNLGMDFAGIIIIVLTEIKVFSLLSSKKIDINTKNLIIIFLLCITIYINGTYNYSITRSFIYLFLLSFINKIVFKTSYSESFLTTCIFYLILVVLELILTVFLIMLPTNGVLAFDKMPMLKTLFTILNSFCLLILFKLKFIKNKMVTLNMKLLFFQNKLIKFFLFSVIVVLIVIAFKNGKSISFADYLINIIFLSLIFMFLLVVIIQEIKMNNFEKKQTILLEFMSNYEKIIDESRINKHEILNNLLLIKSFKNKESKEFDKLLTGIIKNYDTKNVSFRSIYNLPSGLKGLFYYKLYYWYEILDLEILISDKIIADLDKLESKTYEKLYKILGILLDNAIEASSETKEKHILVDIYKSKNKIVFYIENSFEGKVDINKINNIKQSSKGINRGYGLYIVNKILKAEKKLKLIQKITENIFVSELDLKI